LESTSLVAYGTGVQLSGDEVSRYRLKMPRLNLGVALKHALGNVI